MPSRHFPAKSLHGARPPDASKLAFQPRTAIDNARLELEEAPLDDAPAADPTGEKFTATFAALSQARETIDESERPAKTQRSENLTRRQLSTFVRIAWMVPLGIFVDVLNSTIFDP